MKHTHIVDQLEEQFKKLLCPFGWTVEVPFEKDPRRVPGLPSVEFRFTLRRALPPNLGQWKTFSMQLLADLMVVRDSREMQHFVMQHAKDILRGALDILEKE